MKTEHWILLGIGAYFLYSRSQGQAPFTYPANTPPNSRSTGSGGTTASGGGMGTSTSNPPIGAMPGNPSWSNDPNYNPLPGDPNFVGPVDMNPQPGDPNFVGPVDWNPQPGDPNFVGPVSDIASVTDYGQYDSPIYSDPYGQGGIPTDGGYDPYAGYL